MLSTAVLLRWGREEERWWSQGGDREYKSELLATSSSQPSSSWVKPWELGLQAVVGWSSDLWARLQTASCSQTDSGSLSLEYKRAHGFSHCHYLCFFHWLPFFVLLYTYVFTWLHWHTCLGIRPVHWLCWLTAVKAFPNLPLSLTSLPSHSAPHFAGFSLQWFQTRFLEINHGFEPTFHYNVLICKLSHLSCVRQGN